jgi:DNA-directed RNA polymerase specialized sigma24 family protein
LTVTESSERVRNLAEIADAIRSFTPVQWLRLRKVADHYSLGALMGAEDLLQEAFRRALDGERTCPADVDVVRFLAEAIRSIAHSEYKRTKRHPAIVPLAAPGDPVPEAEDPADPTPNVEERLTADEDSIVERKRRIVAFFDDDPVAQTIVEGIMEGTRGEDLRALTDLNPTAYQSKRRLIRRRITKLIRKPKP